MAKRGLYARGVAKREEILRVALDVVARNGLRGTSIKDLADAVNLTQAGLLHYFESKEELFTSILRTRDETDTRRFEDNDDIVGQLLAAIRHNAETPGLVQLFASMSAAATSDSSHAARSYFADRYSRFRVMLSSSIRRRQEAGDVPAEIDADMLASTLIAASDGMQLQWMLDPTIDMAAHVEFLWQTATRGARRTAAQ